MFIVLLILGIWYFCDIQSSSDEELHHSTTKTQLSEHEALAKQYCSGCHTFPDPKLLDKRTWRTQALPSMGPHLGIFEFAGEEYQRDLAPALPKNFYPEQALIDHSQWQRILDYYEAESPDRLHFSGQVPEIIKEDLFFQPKWTSYFSPANPMTSAVRFDPENKIIYLADAALKKILIFNRRLEVIAEFNIPSPVSDIQIAKSSDKSTNREIILTHIGSLAPSDAREGSVIKGWFDTETGEGDFSTVLIDSIRRPVETLEADLDQNGYNDLLISEFGHRRGSLFWLKNDGDRYDLNKRILIETPGCLQSHIEDFTGNGRPDILALCSQADQAIYLFANQGNSTFERSTLLQFPITAGSSSFELVDFNEDGHQDILYTSGDNADYSLTYKPYHGVYIYLNQGDNTFEKKWFYPINGAYSANAVDFDRDGNLDIATISFFANYPKKPQEGFIFFKNNGDFSFTPYHPQTASYGRWIAMDVADWTGNGFDDIVLANLSLGPTKVLPQIESILTQSPHFLVLENIFVQEP